MGGRPAGAGTDGRLLRLARLAAMLRDREAAALARCRNEADALAAEAQALRGMAAAPRPTAFNRAGRLQAMEAWRAAELGRINTRIAALRAEEADLAGRAARAVARAEVLQRLAARATGRSGGVRPPA